MENNGVSEKIKEKKKKKKRKFFNRQSSTTDKNKTTRPTIIITTIIITATNKQTNKQTNNISTYVIAKIIFLCSLSDSDKARATEEPPRIPPHVIVGTIVHGIFSRGVEKWLKDMTGNATEQYLATSVTGMAIIEQKKICVGFWLLLCTSVIIQTPITRKKKPLTACSKNFQTISSCS